LGQLFDVRADITSPAVFKNFRYGTAGAGEDRCAASQRLDHDESERFGPIDWEHETQSSAQEFGFFLVRNLSNILDEATIHMGLDHAIIPVPAFPSLDFGRYLEGNARLSSDLHGPLRAFFGTDASQKGEVAAGRCMEFILLEGKPMGDVTRPREIRNRESLVVTDRNKSVRRFGASPSRHELRKVEPTVKRRDHRQVEGLSQWKHPEVMVIVNDVDGRKF
jgi:hypothetical protein